VAFSEALRRCDVFVFGGHSSFLAGQDLKVLRRAGKRIVWVFTGSDHRPPYLNGKTIRERADEPERLLADVRATRSRVQRIERLSDAVIAHGPSAQFHSRPFAEFLSVGAPVRSMPVTTESAGHGAWPGPPGVRILHCPTDPAKGSDIIRSILGGLAERGHRISYLELSGRPNAEVRSRIFQADLVVDEVFSDTPMALFATEAATAGVPAIVGGYWARDMAPSLPPSAIPPSAFVHPDDLESTLERLVSNEAERRTLGIMAREFVSERWRPEVVAQRVLSLAMGDTTDILIREPAELTYCAGWGMPIETQRRSVRQVIAMGGRVALGLSHNPNLERLMVATANEALERRT
jgi:glycosyltransferase involved in cell wall biosynthesis